MLSPKNLVCIGMLQDSFGVVGEVRATFDFLFQDNIEVEFNKFYAQKRDKTYQKLTLVQLKPFQKRVALPVCRIEKSRRCKSLGKMPFMA